LSADDKPPEPHPLPLTRQWVEDYKRYGTEPKPVEGAATIPLDATGCPDLQALVERAGARPPHQGGYPHITPEEWVEYDRSITAWQAARRTPR
jgi:hypothetical protein